MTLEQLINRFKNVRTTALGLIALSVGGLSVTQSLLVGAPIDWGFVTGLGLLGLIGLNAYDGGL